MYCFEADRCLLQTRVDKMGILEKELDQKKINMSHVTIGSFWSAFEDGDNLIHR